MQHSKKLLETFPDHKVDFTWFTNEKDNSFLFPTVKEFSTSVAKSSTPCFFETQYNRCYLHS